MTTSDYKLDDHDDVKTWEGALARISFLHKQIDEMQQIIDAPHHEANDKDYRYICNIGELICEDIDKLKYVDKHFVNKVKDMIKGRISRSHPEEIYNDYYPF